MKYFLIAFTVISLISCQGQEGKSQESANEIKKQEDLSNEKTRNHTFLKDMYANPYFPKFLVDKLKTILVELCFNIEKSSPENLEELYKLTQASTRKINDLQDEFYRNGSEIETQAREILAEDFEFISNAYGFKADVEELIATRDW